jgi:hypothetical protein
MTAPVAIPAGLLDTEDFCAHVRARPDALVLSSATSATRTLN